MNATIEYRTPFGTFKTWETAADRCERADFDPCLCVEVVHGLRANGMSGHAIDQDSGRWILRGDITATSYASLGIHNTLADATDAFVAWTLRVLAGEPEPSR